MALLTIYSSAASAHSARSILDSTENNANFTALARVTCFNDGSGNTSYLTARVRDNSPAMPDLFINLQLIKGTMAISATDTTSGDASYSDSIALPGGNGVYTMMLNKTRAGARSFEIEWHCVAADGAHTGTEIILDQFK
ncbi:MAG: hypothetical protein V4628_13470 [Pseudomonadota bacterium]